MLSSLRALAQTGRAIIARLPRPDRHWFDRTIKVVALSFVAGIALAFLVPLQNGLAPLKQAAALVALAAALALALRSYRVAGRLRRPVPIALFAFCSGFFNLQYAADSSGSGHLSAYANDVTYLREESTVRGWISFEPEVRDHYTVIRITPYHVVDETGTHQIDRGWIQARVYPTASKFYREVEYGQQIQVTGALSEPAVANNPGQFDMKTFLAHQGCFAEMWIRKDFQVTQVAGRRGNPMRRLALAVQEGFVRVIKKSVPFEESAFLGGVLVGLRQGLPRHTQDAIRAAGLFHVLAVSGLHVTIVSLLFATLFRAARLPRRLSGVLMILLLIVYTFLTGSRPATLRAALMNGFAVFSMYFFNSGLGQSARTGLALSALLILLVNPLLLFEAAFLFSYACVISLVVLTTPVDRFFRETVHGALGAFLFIIGTSAAAAAVASLRFLAQPSLSTWIFPATFGGLLLATRLRKSASVGSGRFANLRLFLAAQAAITIVMMPLTGFFFGAIPLAGPIANLLGLPLIGAVVQVGMLMGVAGLIPELFAGIHPALGQAVEWLLALPFNMLLAPFVALGIRPFVDSPATVLGAASWALSRLFTDWARLCYDWFPYPSVARPPTAGLVGYYALILLVLFRDGVSRYLALSRRRIELLSRTSGVRPRLYGSAVLAAAAAAVVLMGTAPWRPQPLKLVVMDTSVFGMGAGGAIAVRAPSDATLLIDAGPSTVSSRRGPLELNLGERIVAPVVLALGAKAIDLAMVSSIEPDHVGGFPAVLDRIPVKRVVDAWGTDLPVPMDAVAPAGGKQESGAALSPEVLAQWTELFSRFVAALGDEGADAGKQADSTRAVYENYARYRRAIAAHDVPLARGRAGEVIFSEDQGDGKALAVSVLAPPVERFRGRFATGANSLVIKITYGDFSALVTGDIGRQTEDWLLRNARAALRANVVVVPAHGHSWASSPDFIAAISPQLAVVTYHYDKLSAGDVRKTVKRFTDQGITCLTTGDTGAITITSDGSRRAAQDAFTYSTMYPEDS
ncbi:MAG: ComEC/Rec2 family competence protein [Candidatus Schekmanbacteria bacterium]|nr:ComEC/Rec2 family competence protein [Candidatus Schekmanbacteria bacterium]